MLLFLLVNGVPRFSHKCPALENKSYGYLTLYVWKIEAGGCCTLCIYPPGGPVHGLFGGEQRLDPEFFIA